MSLVRQAGWRGRCGPNEYKATQSLGGLWASDGVVGCEASDAAVELRLPTQSGGMSSRFGPMSSAPWPARPSSPKPQGNGPVSESLRRNIMGPGSSRWQRVQRGGGLELAVGVGCRDATSSLSK
nr:hypothetical protein CFP56_07650 [Quercus suber]